MIISYDSFTHTHTRTHPPRYIPRIRTHSHNYTHVHAQYYPHTHTRTILLLHTRTDTLTQYYCYYTHNTTHTHTPYYTHHNTTRTHARTHARTILHAHTKFIYPHCLPISYAHTFQYMFQLEWSSDSLLWVVIISYESLIHSFTHKTQPHASTHGHTIVLKQKYS